jgi:hypothetical protein
MWAKVPSRCARRKRPEGIPAVIAATCCLLGGHVNRFFGTFTNPGVVQAPRPRVPGFARRRAVPLAPLLNKPAEASLLRPCPREPSFTVATKRVGERTPMASEYSES